MDILKRSIAPITDEGWEEIDDQAKEILENQLTGRKFVDVMDPEGWDKSAISKGRLSIVEDSPDTVRYGIREVLPLVETRVSFELNIWELDNLTRGAEDVDLEPLEEAAADAAQFEEKVIYHGLSEAGIEGLLPAAETAIDLPEGSSGILEGASEAVTVFQDRAIEGPYTLVVDKDLWQSIAKASKGYPLKRQLEDLIGGSIIYSSKAEQPLIVPTRSEDLQMALGQDFSIGYEDHGTKKVKLFITESFGFRVLDPAAIVKFVS
ncbi:bacteriocin family protein [Candidatus Bipolaricaulota bacterium]|nr:bacteriocin family protein [Candidatus Bipolaricaulota bacterium]MBS3813952.1 bacteriocin family protein [Candidatus Bipolaricaulota bacterium]